jgi:ATP/maltotriose-dependent transcriptional regulator MalT/DNA-binding MarR family transcriptional regulator
MPRRKAAEGRRVSYYKKKFFFSIRERILLHLSEYSIYENELEVPDELTQFGIADVVLAGRSTCSKLLQEMEDKGLLYGRRAHVPSGKIRRTVYFLTPRGQIEAARIKKKVEETTVKVRTPSGEVKKLRVVDIPKELPVYAPLVDVVCHISRAVFDVESFVSRMKARRQRVAYIGSMPRLRHFFDRTKEREAIDNWLKSKTHKVLTIHGLPGVGKTTLAGRVVTNLKDEMSVFWYRFHEWSTLRNVVQQIGEFLERLNKKDLLMYVETHEVLDVDEVFFLLEKNLRDLKALMVFDDYDKVGNQLDDFFSALKEMLDKVDGPKVIVISRTVPKFYSRRDVSARNLVEELALEGLDREGAATLLTLKNIPDSEFDTIYARTQGHPLFLELVQGPDVADARDIDRFLDEELFSRLLDVERRVLGLASVFRKPVHADALFMDDDVDYVVIASLTDQALLKETMPKVYDVHDLLRSFFYERLTPARRKRYHTWAARFYTAQGGPGDLVEAQYHFLKAENVDAAAKSAVEHGREIIKRGYLEEFSKILEALRKEKLKPDADAQIRLLEGHVKDVQGQWDEALKLYKGVAEQAQKKRNERLEAEARRYIGDILAKRDEDEAAQAELERSLKLYSKLNDLDGQAEVYYSLGYLQNKNSEFMEAYRNFRKGMRCVLKTENKAITAKLLYAFGVNYGQRGNYKKSVSYKVRAMNILEEIRDLHQLAKVYTGLGTSYQELGDPNEALQYYRKGIEYARLIGDQRILAYALQNASGIYMAREKLDVAEELLEEASAIFHTIGEKRKIGWSLLYRGGIYFLRGKTVEAEDAWNKGLQQLRASKDKRGIAMFNLTIARLYSEKGDVVTAAKYLKEAEKAAQEIGHTAVLERIAEEKVRVKEMSKRGEATTGRASVST